jgi:hypothetical protein
VPKDLPIEDIQIDIALDWSPVQALAAYEWLEHIRERIWLLYGDDIAQLARDHATPPEPGAPPAALANPPF